jgi:hypothetical protein
MAILGRRAYIFGEQMIVEPPYLHLLCKVLIIDIFLGGMGEVNDQVLPSRHLYLILSFVVSISASKK